MSQLPHSSQSGLALKPGTRKSGGRLSANEQVARAIGIAIVSGQIGADQRLPPEPELLEEYGISRTVLREALKILTAKGLIASRTYVGTWVLDRTHWHVFDPDVLAWHEEMGLDSALLEEFFEFRLAFEPAAAAMAARRATPEDVADLRACLAAMQAACDDPGAYAQADLALHKAIGAMSGNRLVRGAASVTQASLLGAFEAGARKSGKKAQDRARMARSYAAHQAIVEAIAAGNPAAAHAAMIEAIELGRAGLSPPR